MFNRIETKFKNFTQLGSRTYVKNEIIRVYIKYVLIRIKIYLSLFNGN